MTKTITMPTKESAKEAGIDILSIAGGMMGGKVISDQLIKKDNLTTNLVVTGAGAVGAMATKGWLRNGLIGITVFGLFRTMRNASKSTPLQGVDGLSDTLQMLNPLGEVGEPNNDEVLMLGEVLDEELMGEDEALMLGEADVYETIEGPDGEVIELLGYTDGLGRARKSWVKRAASAAGRAATSVARNAGNVALTVAANKTGLPLQPKVTPNKPAPLPPRDNPIYRNNPNSRNSQYTTMECRTISGLMGGAELDEVVMAI